MNKGTINWFNADKGYGFIMADDMQDVFAYLISIQGNDFKKYDEGQSQKVTFDIKMTSRGRYDSNVHKR
ncbi:cold-shock protein [Streptococcus thermophilus]|uniref:cold-shock protein n=1 Tax=Streptococcus thermophilus TaxID=1308 RepID=UPI000814E8FE|nr:cold shock domain-containing protein [Streptococcus thermophilus]SCB63051.1 Cold shock protein CspA [Streptococcus thermophilus]